MRVQIDESHYRIALNGIRQSLSQKVTSKPRSRDDTPVAGEVLEFLELQVTHAGAGIALLGDHL